MPVRRLAARPLRCALSTATRHWHDHRRFSPVFPALPTRHFLALHFALRDTGRLAAACTHAILDARTPPRAPLPPHRASRRVARPVLSVPSSTATATRPPLRRALLRGRRLLARSSHVTRKTRPPSSPSTTRASLDHRHSTTVLALARDTTARPRRHSSLLRHHRPRAPHHGTPSTGPFLDHATPDHARTAPTLTTRAPVTTRALQRRRRGARPPPSHSPSHTITTRKRPTTASSSSSLRSSPLHAGMRSRPPSTITITTRPHTRRTLSHTLSQHCRPNTAFLKVSYEPGAPRRPPPPPRLAPAVLAHRPPAERPPFEPPSRVRRFAQPRGAEVFVSPMMLGPSGRRSSSSSSAHQAISFSRSTSYRICGSTRG